jgi:hypothetical protein
MSGLRRQRTVICGTAQHRDIGTICEHIRKSLVGMRRRQSHHR